MIQTHTNQLLSLVGSCGDATCATLERVHGGEAAWARVAGSRQSEGYGGVGTDVLAYEDDEDDEDDEDFDDADGDEEGEEFEEEDDDFAEDDDDFLDDEEDDLDDDDLGDDDDSDEDDDDL